MTELNSLNELRARRLEIADVNSVGVVNRRFDHAFHVVVGNCVLPVSSHRLSRNHGHQPKSDQLDPFGNDVFHFVLVGDSGNDLGNGRMLIAEDRYFSVGFNLNRSYPRFAHDGELYRRSSA